MFRYHFENRRQLLCETIESDLVVVGGGLAGCCTAITAARAGLRVALVQDRPVLGGNASSEVRLWVLGATAHNSNNNRWSREGGVIDEILTENLYRNRQGNPVIVDTVILDFVQREPNIRLLLNTAAYEVTKESPDAISGVTAFCSQNSTRYELRAPLFCDASGDGVLAFLAGAAFRMGAEPPEEFGEQMAPDEAYGELLGHSIYFYTKDVGEPVDFVPPSYALRDVPSLIPRYRRFNTGRQGCQLWWIEYGGRMDTVHETEAIKWELWRIVYGVWDYIKNSGDFPDAANLTLEWVGTIPGKRESRRFQGDYMLTQRDLVEQRTFPDAVSFGGWSLDLHPADGVYSTRAKGCDQWHAKGVYQIPYRCMYSRSIENLFLAGRIISASHVAFGSTRVMATCAHGGQAVAIAAALCREHGILPRGVYEHRHAELQQRLLRRGQFIPGVPLHDEADLARTAEIDASSSFTLDRLPASEQWLSLREPQAMILPLRRGAVPSVRLVAHAHKTTTIHAELRLSSKTGNFTPDTVMAQASAAVGAHRYATVGGDASTHAQRNESTDHVALDEDREYEEVTLDFDAELDRDGYAFVCLSENEGVSLRLSDANVTGIARVRRRATDNGFEAQVGADEIGAEDFEFWTPERRPHNKNLSLALDPAPASFAPSNLTDGYARPFASAHAWVAELDDEHPAVQLKWERPQRIARIDLSFDTDFDHPMQSVIVKHPNAVSPLCVRRFRIVNGSTGEVLHQCTENHHPRYTAILEKIVELRCMRIEMEKPSPTSPASLFEVRCYDSVDIDGARQPE